ncbi:MAG: hypothetical protein ACFBZ8_10805 [Opitutales bacterium]
MKKTAIRRVIYVYFGVMFVLHQDFWFRDDPTLLFGFYPVTFAWHTGFSIAAALGWLSLVLFAWPEEEIEAVEAMTEDTPPPGNPTSR